MTLKHDCPAILWTENYQFMCTLEKGHQGAHIAHSDIINGTIAKTWPNEDD